MVVFLKSAKARSAARRLLGPKAHYTGGTYRSGSRYLRAGKKTGWTSSGRTKTHFSIRDRASSKVRNGSRSREITGIHGYGYDRMTKSRR